MRYQRRTRFGFGTILSLIVVYFIYLYSKDKGWTLLAFISKWYLIISLGIIGIFAGIIILTLLLFFITFIIALIRNKTSKKRKTKEQNYIDAEYEIKE